MFAPRFVVVLALAAVLTGGLTGCGKDPSTGPLPNPSATRSAPRAGEPTRDPLEAPTTPPEGAPFTFDQAARYDDGLLVEVATIRAAQTTATQQGAEGTSGQVVIAELVITNQSNKPFAADAMSVDGYYSAVGAPKIVDTSGAVGDSFRGTIPAGGQARARFGFAMPFDQLDHVAIVVDGGDDAHGPVQFTGQVTRG